MSNTISKIVENAGVSRATAYRVLSGSASVSEETRRRVLQAVPDEKITLRRRRRLATRVAVWVPGLGELVSWPHHLAVVRAIEKAAAERKLSLEVINLPVPEDPAEAVAVLESRKVGGVMLLSFYSQKHRQLVAGRWPTVLFFDRGHGEGLADVGPDDFAAGYLATQHLIECGHRRIAVAVGGGQRPIGFSRRFAGGYALACLEAGLETDSALVLANEANLKFLVEGAKFPPAGSDFLNLKPRPTALIGRCVTVSGVMHQLAAEGISVPGDVSVIGYGSKGWELFEPPGLTRVEYSAEEMAGLALDVLASRPGVRANLTVPVRLETGGSVSNLKESASKRETAT